MQMQFMLYFTLIGALGTTLGMNETTRHQANVTTVDGEVQQCSTCEFREHSRLMRLHNIRSQILSILRLEQAPNISGEMIRQLLPKAPILTQFIDQYGHRVEDEDIFPYKSGKVCTEYHCVVSSISVQRFDLTTFYMHTVTTVLHISHIKSTTEGNSGIRILSLKIDVASGASSWQSVDINQLHKTWLHQPETHYGLEIKAYDSKRQDLAVTVAELGEEGLQPFMEVKILENLKRSRRDSGLDCDEESSETRCCRYPLTVDFEAFGWDWIIAPKRYKANYCSGDCEYMHLQKYPHTHLVNKANARGTTGLCCTPTKMSPLRNAILQPHGADNLWEDTIYGACCVLWCVCSQTRTSCDLRRLMLVGFGG
uniref:Growth/differentiation factor 8 n=1 Tax=Hucho hucho TaxID=62062 RepID=A0A4W5NH98_9TELE